MWLTAKGQAVTMWVKDLIMHHKLIALSIRYGPRLTDNQDILFRHNIPRVYRLNFQEPGKYQIFIWNMQNVDIPYLLTSLVAQTVKCLAYNAGGLGSIPGSGRSSGEGNDNPLQYSCLENPIDRGAWWATVHWVAKSWT